MRNILIIESFIIVIFAVWIISLQNVNDRLQDELASTPQVVYRNPDLVESCTKWFMSSDLQSAKSRICGKHH